MYMFNYKYQTSEILRIVILQIAPNKSCICEPRRNFDRPRKLGGRKDWDTGLFQLCSGFKNMTFCGFFFFSVFQCRTPLLLTFSLIHFLRLLFFSTFYIRSITFIDNFLADWVSGVGGFSHLFFLESSPNWSLHKLLCQRLSLSLSLSPFFFPSIGNFEIIFSVRDEQQWRE